jgi:hypothetical protein
MLAAMDERAEAELKRIAEDERHTRLPPVKLRSHTRDSIVIGRKLARAQEYQQARARPRPDVPRKCPRARPRLSPPRSASVRSSSCTRHSARPRLSRPVRGSRRQTSASAGAESAFWSLSHPPPAPSPHASCTRVPSRAAVHPPRRAAPVPGAADA